MKRIINKSDGKVKRTFPDDEAIIMRPNEIFLPNFPTGPRVIGNVTWLGGTYYCDQNSENSSLIEEKDGKFIEKIKTKDKTTEKEYDYDAENKRFTPCST